jgi:flavin reductase (DIM6/NTAB) family NADH-FMN oxidoreductase RutF
MSEISKEQKAAGVGAIPSGLFIICTKDSEGTANGFLGSWVQQVSFDPLLVALCINPSRPGYEEIMAGKPFSINVVGEHEKNYLKHFWRGYSPEDNPFKSEIQHTDLSEAVAMKDAKSVIVCRLKESLNPGDHHIVVAEVIDSVVNDEEAKPMVHIRKTGLDY